MNLEKICWVFHHSNWQVFWNMFLLNFFIVIFCCREIEYSSKCSKLSWFYDFLKRIYSNHSISYTAVRDLSQENILLLRSDFHLLWLKRFHPRQRCHCNRTLQKKLDKKNWWSFTSFEKKLIRWSNSTQYQYISFIFS